MTTIYGIKNCDTMKKAFRWLEENNVEYAFHDYRKDGLERDLLASWIEQLGWEAVVNKRGTTWRKLEPEIQAAMNNETAVEVLLEQPAMIKRPLLDHQQSLTLGFKPEQYQAIFQQ
ncbi:ArsC family reductase [Marinomonas fungiae]|uniref:Transcriptional regulator, Spx/MgsR family n=1 Tax=Marinomonas fungiae TaxID=1137284 RepID=A0A0K6IP99_9GAMM|nr:ArsC family reductase [Marinomonas fungiae]CUB04950.1 transcriptional regulator, Spx/MgsR family [Marinomonas fungiae]